VQRQTWKRSEDSTLLALEALGLLVTGFYNLLGAEVLVFLFSSGADADH